MLTSYYPPVTWLLLMSPAVLSGCPWAVGSSAATNWPRRGPKARAPSCSCQAPAFGAFDRTRPGKMQLYLDPNGVGERQELSRGAIFGEKHFRTA